MSRPGPFLLLADIPSKAFPGRGLSRVGFFKEGPATAMVRSEPNIWARCRRRWKAPQGKAGEVGCSCPSRSVDARGLRCWGTPCQWQAHPPGTVPTGWPPHVPWGSSEGSCKTPTWPSTSGKGQGLATGPRIRGHVLPVALCRRNGSSALAPGPCAQPEPILWPCGQHRPHWEPAVAPSPGCPSSRPRLPAPGIYGGVGKTPMK